ncbi:neutral zinc metallopeptidase [Streptomyces sp. NPDC054841]
MRQPGRLTASLTGLAAALVLVFTGAGGSVAAEPPPTPTDPAPTASGDVEERLGQYRPEPGESSTKWENSGVDPRTAQGLATYLRAVLDDIHTYWAGYFRANGMEEPSVLYYTPLPGDSVTTECLDTPVVHDTPQGAFYCPLDVRTDAGGNTYTGAIYFPPTTLVNDSTSKFAIAVIAAHEYGHDIQRELMEKAGLPDIVAMKDDEPVLEDGDTVRIKESELLADCFAGTWVRSAYRQGDVTPANIRQAVEALADAGDPVPGPERPHGTEHERTSAFELGYDAGHPLACMRQYWVTHDWS